MRKARILSGAIGAAALAVLVYRIGLEDIAAQVRSLGVVLPVVFVAGAMRILLQTRAWATALSAEGIHVPQSRLVAVRFASQAAGYLAALGPVVSEPAKFVFLRKSGGVAAATATLVETGIFWLTTVILGLAGACAAAFLIADARVVWAAAAVFAVAFALLVTRRSLLAPLVRAEGSRTPQWLRSAEQVELRIRSFRDRHPRATQKILALDSIAQLLTLAEVAAVLWASGIRVSVLHVLAIEAAGRIVKILGAWIPGRIGVDEGGAAASFALLGLPSAAGLMLAVARRLRDVSWCAAGILWAARMSPVSLCTEER
jgi:hypothetical protein